METCLPFPENKGPKLVNEFMQTYAISGDTN